jgi:sugar-specific transcriptional regulator TrmB
MTVERLRDNLKLLGLSDKEISVYLTILDHGKVTVSRVIDESDVSRRHVYQMCERLDDRGLVVLNDHVRPSVVHAQAADSAIERIDSRLGELKSDIDATLTDTSVTDPDVELIKSGQTLTKRCRSAIDAATAELFICMPATVFDRFRPELAAAVDRGVAVYALVTDPGLDSFDTERLPVTLARTCEDEPYPLVTADGERVILDDPKLLTSTIDGSAMSIVRQALAETLCASYISNFWSRGREVTRKDPPELPYSYPTLRQATVDAASHLAAGRELYATITARQVETGEIVEMESVPVVESNQRLIEPFTTDYPMQNALAVRYEGDVVTVGSTGVVGGTYEALDIRLEDTST